MTESVTFGTPLQFDWSSKCIAKTQNGETAFCYGNLSIDGYSVKLIEISYVIFGYEKEALP